MEKILTIQEMRTALYLDFDYDVNELERLSILASYYLKTKTGFDWTSEVVIEPLAKQAAILYVRMQFFENNNYKKEYDFSIGLNSLLIDLQTIAQEKTVI